ncbi:MAG: hypothetical protein KatS3mg109_2354 [Pirellulaceae bacterium]|nr:MAG: hypothetical protein KatS3mg109_2354 [Pirellulaceae bacterium]
MRRPLIALACGIGGFGTLMLVLFLLLPSGAEAPIVCSDSGDCQFLLIQPQDSDEFWLLDTRANRGYFVAARRSVLPRDSIWLKNTCYGTAPGENGDTIWIGCQTANFGLRPIFFLDRRTGAFVPRGQLPYARLNFLTRDMVVAYEMIPVGEPSASTLGLPRDRPVTRVYRWDGDDYQGIDLFSSLLEKGDVEVLGVLDDRRWVLLHATTPDNGYNLAGSSSRQPTNEKKILVFDSVTESVLSERNVDLDYVKPFDIAARWYQYLDWRWRVTPDRSLLVMVDLKKYRSLAWKLPSLEQWADLYMDETRRVAVRTALSPDGKYVLAGFERLVLLDLQKRQRYVLDDTAQEFEGFFARIRRGIPVLGPMAADALWNETVAAGYYYIHVGWIDSRRCVGITASGVMRTFDVSAKRCLSSRRLWPAQELARGEPRLRP